MQILVRRLLALATLLLATTVHAAPFSYTNVDVSILSTELINSDLDGDGVLVRGSFAFHPSFFMIGSLSDVGYDVNVDGFAWTVGVGGHMPINNQLDLVGRLSYVNQNLEYDGGDNDDNGYTLSGAVRWMVIEKLELEGGVQHVSLDDSGNETFLFGEGRYHFTDRFAGGVIVHLGDASAFGVHVRFSF